MLSFGFLANSDTPMSKSDWGSGFLQDVSLRKSIVPFFKDMIPSSIAAFYDHSRRWNFSIFFRLEKFDLARKNALFRAYSPRQPRMFVSSFFFVTLSNLQKIHYILVKTWWNRKGVTFTISSNLRKIHQFLIKFGENRKWLSRILIKPTLSLFQTKHANFETKTFLNLFYCAEFGFPKLVPNFLFFL